LSFYQKNLFLTRYFIGSSDLECINSVTDLGVLFNHNLNFNDHIGIIVSKAKGCFAFVKRWSKEFEETTKHISLVRPILNTVREFGHLKMLSVRSLSSRYRNETGKHIVPYNLKWIDCVYWTCPPSRIVGPARVLCFFTN